jgi:hypothetical protein
MWERGGVKTVDADRMRELEAKAAGPGLSDEEADELGKLFAEESHESYADADIMQAEHAFDDADQPLKERKRRGPSKARAGDPGSVPDAVFDWARISQVPGPGH